MHAEVFRIKCYCLQFTLKRFKKLKWNEGWTEEWINDYIVENKYSKMLKVDVMWWI